MPETNIGSTIIENCSSCRNNVRGYVDLKGIASFTCPTCHAQWSYSVVGKTNLTNNPKKDLTNEQE
jgi:transposase-like protein